MMYLFDVWTCSVTACNADNAADMDKFFCTAENKCIPRMWKCDGTADCNSTSPQTSEDELNCGGMF